MAKAKKVISNVVLADIFDRYRKDPVFWAEHFLGVYTWGKMREILYSIRDHKRTAVRAAHGVSKCKEENELVQLSNGQIVKAKDLIDKVFEIESFDIEKNQRVFVNGWATNNGYQKIKNIKLKNGIELKVTDNHPLWIKSKNGFTNKFNENDFIAVPIKTNIKKSDYFIDYEKINEIIVDIFTENQIVIPDEFFKLNDEQIIYFLNSLYATMEFVFTSKDIVDSLYILLKRTGMERPVIKKIKEHYLIEFNHECITEKCPNGFYWEEIESIKYEMANTVAITIPENNVYVTPYAFEHNTYSAAVAALWFYNVFEQSVVITTAPIFPQVDKLLWAEIRAFYQKNPMLWGECLKTEVRDHKNSKHTMLGFSTDDPARAEGFHAPYILYIFDEAKGIPQWMWDSAKGAMNAGYARWLAISTTDGVVRGEHFHQAFEQPDVWNCISISAYDTPDVTKEKFTSLTKDLQRIEKTYDELGVQISGNNYIMEGIRDWGEHSVLFKTKVLGEIVDEGAEAIVNYGDIKQMFKNYENENFDDSDDEEVGVDIARMGSDSTKFYKRKGFKITAKKTMSKLDTMEVVEELEKFVNYDKNILIKMDSTGLGAGPYDRMKQLNYNVVPIVFGSNGKDNDRYQDCIAEMWYEVAAIIKNIACPYDRELEKQLSNRMAKPMDKKGRRGVESKADYKKRMGEGSPDDADAFLLSFYNPYNSQFNIRVI